jgi:hypothetical protein
MVSSHFGTPLGVGTSHGHFGPWDTPQPGLGGSHHLPPYSILCATFWGLHPNGSFFLGTPKLESRNCPETVPGEVSGLWELITPDCRVWSQRGLNQTCSPRRHLSNDVSHSQFGCREEVDSRLLVVGSQIASLTPGPSFAHNLGDRCPNGQCEVIFDMYASRPFQWHQEHPNARCFGSFYRALNIRESWRTPNLHFFQVLGFTPTLGQSRVATISPPLIVSFSHEHFQTKLRAIGLSIQLQKFVAWSPFGYHQTSTSHPN